MSKSKAKGLDGNGQPLNIITMTRPHGRSVVVTTTAPITSEYMQGVAEHVKKVEANWKPPVRKFF